jgi:hypothetical protein
MIKKISTNDYLKRLDNMNGEERQAYLERVGKWLCSNAAQRLVRHMGDPGAQLQNVMVCSMGWNDKECEAFDEGVQLLTAVVHSEDTWLPDMLYVKAAKRVIRRMVEILKRVCQEAAMDIAVREGRSMSAKPDGKGGLLFKLQAETGPRGTKPVNARGEVPGRTANRKPKEESAEGATKATQAVGEGSQTKTTTELKPVRPKHIDQYVHLLPQKTQERAAQVKDLLRDMDVSREKMRLLMDDETASAADREAWAKKVTSIDNKIRKIYDELDREWDNLVKEGRVVLDDLGNARVVESVRGQVPGSANSQDGSARDLSPDRLTELTSEQRKQRKALRKWLTDTRYGNGATREDYVKRWQENFKKFLEYDGEAAYKDEKILAAAKHYGIEIKK